MCRSRLQIINEIKSVPPISKPSPPAIASGRPIAPRASKSEVSAQPGRPESRRRFYRRFQRHLHAVYVGAVGSLRLGAVSLFLFSLGIAVPYLLAAFFLSRALPILHSLQRAASAVGLVCSVVLIFFGVILITDTFHIPSNLLYRLYLGL